MKQIWRALVLVVFPMLGASAVFAQRPVDSEVKALIVEFQPGVVRVAGGPKVSSRLDELTFTNNEIGALLRSASCERITQAVSNYNPADSVVINPYGIPVRLPAFDRIFTFYFRQSADVNLLQSRLQKMRGVVYAEKVMPHLPAYDPLYQFQWGLQNNGQGGGVPGEDIGAERAWQTTTGSPGVRVGVLGVTRVYGDHPDLKDRIIYRNTAGGEAHETHVAGIIGAIANNDIGVRGVDWQARLCGYFLPQDPAGTASLIVQAARDQLCNVLNNSWTTGNAYFTVERQAFATAYMLDRVTVAAMDNWGDNIPSYPAAYGQGIVAVGAMTNGGARAGYSCYGGHIDVIAPGGDEARVWLSDNIRNIKSTYYGPYPGHPELDTLYRYAGGTSMAAPFVSGIAALLKGYRPDLCNDDIEKIICYSARDKFPTGWDEQTGWGLARADQALDMLKPPYVLDHLEHVGGTVDSAYGDPVIALCYRVKSPFIRFPHPFVGVYSWGRGVATIGRPPLDPLSPYDFGMGWCEPVYVTNEGCSLVTYVYRVPVRPGEPPTRWIPCDPPHVKFSYTALGLPPRYAAEIVSSTYPSQLLPGEQGMAHIVYRNIGRETWNNMTRLGTTVPRDRSSPFYTSGSWLSPNRVAQVQTPVPPGGTYQFDVLLTAPNQPYSLHYEHFNLVQDGVMWFSDPQGGGPADDAVEFRIMVLGTPVTVTVQNLCLDLRNRTDIGSVWIDGQEHPSPFVTEWRIGEEHRIGATGFFEYNRVRQNWCNWSDTWAPEHTIWVTPEGPREWTAYYKIPPALSAYYDGQGHNVVSWSWRPNSRPPGFQDFLLTRLVYYRGGGWSWRDFPPRVDNTFIDDTVSNPNNSIAKYVYFVRAQISPWFPWMGSTEFEILWPPPSGDPLISNSNDSLATGYPNGQKVVLDRKDRLHVVFTSSDTVYYTESNKKAKKWSTPVAVGLGKFPAIAMDSQDDPHVLWISGTQVLSSHLSGGVWTTPYNLYSQPLAQTIEAPSFVINTANDSGYAAWTLVVAESSVVSLASFVPGDTTAPISVLNVDVGAGTPFASPSLALDPQGKALLTWSREGEVYFEERGGARLNLSQSSELSIHPVVDAYGDRVSVTYQERDSSGAFKVYRVLKEDGAWGVPQPINLFSGNAIFPAVAGASQVAFSSNVTGEREIYWHGEYEDGGVICGTTLSASSEGEHNFPSIALDNDWPKATLHGVWTAGPGDPIKVKSISIEVPPVPLVFVDPGKATPSSHTVQRAGTVTYGSQPYLTADTHPEKLIYRFSGLNPNKRYRLGATYYFEKLGETWKMRLKVDGRDGMRTRISSGERVDDSNWIPASVYQDGVIDVEITPDAGDFALCNEIALYEFNRGSGGPQTDEAGPFVALPLTYALGQSYPNPFRDNATIAYQLPEETPVSLKVFNVTGQVVRELASGKQKAGFYNAVWDGKDGFGRSVSSGIYFYRLDTGGFSKTNKLVVVR